MTTILTWVTRRVKIGPENRQEGLSIAGSFGRGRYPIAKNACQAIECFSSSHFHAATWERFKRSENGCRMNWTIGRWSDAKTHAKFCLSRQKRKSFLHRIVTGDEKWIYFQNPKRKKSWVDPAQLTSSSKSNHFGRKTMLCVWWDQEGVIYYKLKKSGETVKAHRYHQQLIKFRAPCSAWKKAVLSEKTWQADFPPRQRTIAHVNNDPKLLGDTQLGNATPSRLLTRLGTFWLSPVFVDGPRARWAALRFLRRRPKMIW